MSDDQRTVISNLDHVLEVNFGKITEILYEGGQQETREILIAMLDHNIPVYSFQPRSKTLEDLYLDIYGTEALVEEEKLQ